MGISGKRRLAGAATTAILAALFWNSPAHGISIQFGAAPTIMAPNVLPGMTILDFPAQANPGGQRWDTTPGRVILNVVAGPAGTTDSATLTLTGQPNGPDGIPGNADDGRFEIIFDPLAGAPALANFVRITFSSAPPLPSFPPIPPLPMDAATLDGSIHTKGPDAVFGTADDPPLPVGVRLEDESDAGKLGFIGPFNAPGAFGQGIVLIGPDSAPPVTAVSGTLTFAFDPDVHVAGDFVRLRSAVVLAQLPEPTTLGMLAVGLVGLGVVARWRKSHSLGCQARTLRASALLFRSAAARRRLAKIWKFGLFHWWSASPRGHATVSR